VSGSAIHRRGLRGVLPDWARRFDSLALFCFVFGMMFLHGYGQQRALGLLMVFAFLACHAKTLLSSFRPLLPIPPELKCYTAWVIWAGVTGPMVARDMGYFWGSYKVVLQMLVMVWAIYGILRMRRHTGILNAVFLAVACGGLVQIGSVLSGIQDMQTLLTEGRVFGETSNANSLGFMMNWTGLCALIFWYSAGRQRLTLKHIAILLLIPACGYVMLASGSRKSAVAFALLIGLWGTYASAPRNTFQNQLKRLILGGAIIALIVELLPWAAENTVLGQRFSDFFEQGGGSVQASMETNVRYWMYVEGLKTFLEHPVFGVGMYNFNLYFYTGQFSHSNYIEPLVTTGLVGFLLYQAFYACILVRAFRLLRRRPDTGTAYRLKMIVIGIVVMLVIGVGTPHYTSTPVYVLLTAFMTCTWELKLAMNGRE